MMSERQRKRTSERQKRKTAGRQNWARWPAGHEGEEEERKEEEEKAAGEGKDREEESASEEDKRGFDESVREEKRGGAEDRHLRRGEKERRREGKEGADETAETVAVLVASREGQRATEGEGESEAAPGREAPSPRRPNSNLTSCFPYVDLVGKIVCKLSFTLWVAR